MVNVEDAWFLGKPTMPLIREGSTYVTVIEINMVTIHLVNYFLHVAEATKDSIIKSIN